MANTSEGSDGVRYTTAQVNKRVSDTKAKFVEEFRDNHGYHFCESCKKSTGVRLTCSHILSVDYCKKEGMTEVAWDINNLELLCIKCHDLHERLSTLEKIQKYEEKAI